MIAVDIGNTSINIAWFKNGRIGKMRTIATDQAKSESIRKIFSQDPYETVIICSVVPQVTDLFAGLKQKVYVVGKDINAPIKSLYDRRLVGMDRLVGAYAANCLFRRPRIIIDFGTAITLDFLSARGVYQGGVILPGIGSTQRVLGECALLPDKIRLSKTKAVIPKNTQDSISKGLQLGFSYMINGVVQHYKSILKIKPPEKIIVTGGEAALIREGLEFSYHYEPCLVFKGLFLLSKNICL